MQLLEEGGHAPGAVVGLLRVCAHPAARQVIRDMEWHTPSGVRPCPDDRALRSSPGGWCVSWQISSDSPSLWLTR